MSTKDRIKDLCKNNGISVNKLEIELGFGTGYISKLDKSTPNTKKIQKIADRFNVSVDYLITGKETEFTIEMGEKDAALSEMSETQKDYALKLSQLSKENQLFVMEMIDRLKKGEDK